MIDGHPVTAWIPYGRARTVSILVEYLRRDHLAGIVDELWLYLNTDPDQQDDVRYAYTLASQYEWVKIKYRPASVPLQRPKQRNTGYAYRLMVDPEHVSDPANTVFVRFDDDIVYVHESAVERLVRARLDMDATARAGGAVPPMCVFPVIWNNAICSWFAQQLGHIPKEFGTVGRPYCMDPTGWANGEFAVRIHRLLLDRIDAGTVDEFLWYQDYQLDVGQQFSVSCFAASGADYLTLADPGVLVPDEEESWHTMHRPRATGVPNVIRGDALVSHLTFFPQHAHVFATDILDRYRDLAERAAPRTPPTPEPATEPTGV